MKVLLASLAVLSLLSSTAQARPLACAGQVFSTGRWYALQTSPFLSNTRDIGVTVQVYEARRWRFAASTSLRYQGGNVWGGSTTWGTPITLSIRTQNSVDMSFDGNLFSAQCK